jgi:myo-inositol-1(or 4)-monophosphatase
MPEAAAPSPDAEVWLAAFRRACDRISTAIAPMPPAERARTRGRGAGGDITVAVDRIAEDIVLEELEALGTPVSVISEEVGEVALRGGSATAVAVVDPIDGSLNAKRGLPVFATSIALARGRTMGDVTIGLVRDHGTGEEWVAERGRGAWLDGVRLSARTPSPSGILELVLVEGAYPARVSRMAAFLEGRVGRMRALGSLALSTCQTAAGRGDAMVGLRPARAVDVAAAQLVALEAGLAVGVPEEADLAATPLDLAGRFHFAAAHDGAGLELMGRATRE